MERKSCSPLNLAKGNEDVPEKKPRVYFIIPCSQITFHGSPVGMRLSTLCFTFLAVLIQRGNYNLRVRF